MLLLSFYQPRICVLNLCNAISPAEASIAPKIPPIIPPANAPCGIAAKALANFQAPPTAPMASARAASFQFCLIVVPFCCRTGSFSEQN